MTLRIGLIGFGEVGQTLGQDLPAHGVADLIAFDRLFADPASPPSIAARGMDLVAAEDIASACHDRDLVISAVTAAEAHSVAQAAAPYLRGVTFLDLNSVAPETRLASSLVIHEQGGRYIEAAVMAPIALKRLQTPMLLGGPHAADFAPKANRLGLAVEAFSPKIGPASAVKLCRSIFVKGLEAIITESLTSARHFGVEAEVLASLNNTLPHADWSRLAHYLVTRPLTHGRRRSEEMAEAVGMLLEAGLDAPMARATVELQARQGALGLVSAADQADTLPELLDAVTERSIVTPRIRKD